MARAGNNHKGGRPKGSVGTHTLEASKLREFIIEKVGQNAEPLLQAKMALALGHKVMTTNGSVVYTKSPDGNAIQYLLNQVVGKPRDTIELHDDVRLLIDI